MSNVSDTVVCPVCAEHIPADYVVCPYDGASLVKELRAKAKVKIRLREGISRGIRVINPQETPKVIDEYATNPDRKGALFILFVCSFFFAFRLAPYFNAATNNSYDILFMIIFGFASGLLLGPIIFLFAVAFWYGISLIFHISAKYLSGSQTATYKESQGLVGYMFAPLMLGLILFNLLLFFIVPTGADNYFDDTPSSGDILLAPVYSFSDSFNENYQLINLLFFLIFLIWGAWILSIGTEKMYRTKRTQSMLIAAAAPAVLIILAFFT